MVEENLHADLASVSYDFVDDPQSVDALKIRIFGKVDPVGLAGRVKKLVGIGQADGVETELFHLIHHLFIASRPKAMGRKVGCFETKPVDSGKAYGLIIGVNNLIPNSVHKTSRTGWNPADWITFRDGKIINRDGWEGRRWST